MRKCNWACIPKLCQIQGPESRDCSLKSKPQTLNDWVLFVQLLFSWIVWHSVVWITSQIFEDAFFATYLLLHYSLCYSSWQNTFWLQWSVQFLQKYDRSFVYKMSNCNFLFRLPLHLKSFKVIPGHCFVPMHERLTCSIFTNIW